MTTLSTTPSRELTYEPIHECGPTESIKPQAASAKGWRIVCPCCDAMMMPCKIVTDRHQYDMDLRHHTVRRRVPCVPCNKIIAWTESADETGKPTHSVISGPSLYSGSVADFLRSHPASIHEDIT